MLQRPRQTEQTQVRVLLNYLSYYTLLSWCYKGQDKQSRSRSECFWIIYLTTHFYLDVTKAKTNRADPGQSASELFILLHTFILMLQRPRQTEQTQIRVLLNYLSYYTLLSWCYKGQDKQSRPRSECFWIIYLTTHFYLDVTKAKTNRADPGQSASELFILLHTFILMLQRPRQTEQTQVRVLLNYLSYYTLLSWCYKGQDKQSRPRSECFWIIYLTTHFYLDVTKAKTNRADPGQSASELFILLHTFILMLQRPRQTEQTQIRVLLNYLSYYTLLSWCYKGQDKQSRPRSECFWIIYLTTHFYLDVTKAKTNRADPGQSASELFILLHTFILMLQRPRQTEQTQVRVLLNYLSYYTLLSWCYKGQDKQSRPRSECFWIIYLTTHFYLDVTKAKTNRADPGQSASELFILLHTFILMLQRPRQTEQTQVRVLLNYLSYYTLLSWCYKGQDKQSRPRSECFWIIYLTTHFYLDVTKAKTNRADPGQSASELFILLHTFILMLQRPRQTEQTQVRVLLNYLSYYTLLSWCYKGQDKQSRPRSDQTASKETVWSGSSLFRVCIFCLGLCSIKIKVCSKLNINFLISQTKHIVGIQENPLNCLVIDDQRITWSFLRMNFKKKLQSYGPFFKEEYHSCICNFCDKVKITLRICEYKLKSLL